jgi:hypothetical protein
MIKLKSLLTEAVCGQCFSWAFRKVAKGGPFLDLVHGTIQSQFLGKRINHAWVETKNRVFDWQNHESLDRKHALANIGLWIDVDDKTKVEYYRKGFPKRLYYKMTKAKVDNKYKKLDAGITMLKSKHFGPWD